MSGIISGVGNSFGCREFFWVSGILLGVGNSFGCRKFF